MTTLLLIRHAESTWNHIGRYQGRIDTELSDLGHQQAKLLGKRLSRIPLDAIYSSPLRRALDVAQAVATAQEKTVTLEDGLMEIDHGAWNGMLKAKVAERYGAILEQWRTSPSQVLMPGGESLDDVSRRTNVVMDRVLANQTQGTVVICTHDAVLRVIIAASLGLSFDRIWAIGLESASITTLQVEDGRPYLTCLNDTCHLGKYRSVMAEQAL